MIVRLSFTFYLIVLGFCYIFAEIGIETESKDGISWELFKVLFNKTYKNGRDEAEHKVIFISNLKAVLSHNLDFDEGRVLFRKQINLFADIDPKEFRKRNGFRASFPSPLEDVDKFTAQTNKGLPKSYDLRTAGVLTPVKYQGKCGGCWAFAATSALESQVLLHNRSQVTLSEQHLVSCDNKGRNQACKGGMYTNAWDYIIKVSKGIMGDASYPYTSKHEEVGPCQFNSNQIVLKMSSYKWVSSDETSIMTALVKHGPLAVAMDATDLQLADTTQVYRCSGRLDLEHAVTVVGYGTRTDGQDYWIIKNSWSAKWGVNKGYFFLARGKGDCGLSKYPAFPIL